MTREELLNSAEYWQGMAENEWHKVEDELPSKPDKDSVFSNEVLMTDGEKVYVGFCSYETKTWYNINNLPRTLYRITHWKELPQLS